MLLKIFVKFLKVIFFTIILTLPNLAQDEGDIEFFIIDSFVTPEKPNTFKISFFTNEEVKTEIKIDDRLSFTVSENSLEDHSINIDFTDYKFSKKNIPYQLIAIDANGKKHFSEMFDVTLPYEEFIETKEGKEPISTILMGMFLYLLPSPNMVVIENENYFSLTKEIPIITFYSSGYNYPSANISLEYSHIYNSPLADVLRLGYKQILSLDAIEYVSPGITGFTNFDGFNGIGAELSLGLFKIYDVFTVYTRYRYNTQPTNFDNYFHEFSIGLYSHFFTIDF